MWIWADGTAFFWDGWWQVDGVARETVNCKSPQEGEIDPHLLCTWNTLHTKSPLLRAGLAFCNATHQVTYGPALPLGCRATGNFNVLNSSNCSAFPSIPGLHPWASCPWYINHNSGLHCKKTLCSTALKASWRFQTLDLPGASGNQSWSRRGTTNSSCKL